MNAAAALLLFRLVNKGMDSDDMGIAASHEFRFAWECWEYRCRHNRANRDEDETGNRHL